MPILLNRPDTAAGIEPVHEARQVPALVQAHADGQAAVEVGLATMYQPHRAKCSS